MILYVSLQCRQVLTEILFLEFLFLFLILFWSIKKLVFPSSIPDFLTWKFNGKLPDFTAIIHIITCWKCEDSLITGFLVGKHRTSVCYFFVIGLAADLICCRQLLILLLICSLTCIWFEHGCLVDFDIYREQDATLRCCDGDFI